MKILFQNRPKSSWQGGDYVQLEATAEALRNLGIEIDISEDLILPVGVIEQYDIVHLWNFSMIWTKYQLWLARKYNKPVVCSMIYHESDQYVTYPEQQVMLDNLACAIFLTDGEKERVKRHLILNENNTAIIENGISSFWTSKSQQVIPMEPYVLTVGRIEANKGQLAVAKACKQLGLPYVIIGEANDKEYLKLCEAWGALWKPKMTAEELKPWYSSAKCFVLASKAEVYPLTVMEAISQGVPIILTDMCEWNVPFARCAHDDVDSIKTAITKAIEEPVTIDLKSWGDIAQEIKSIYEKICQK